MEIKAYSSISVFNLTNVGSINFYLTSNMPNNVIYNPNSATYSPDWTVNNLIITPVITYNGQTLSLTDSNLVISYSKMLGTIVSNLGSGENVSGGVLTVSNNNISSSPSGQLTYKCVVTYTDPRTNTPLQTEASITYVMISTATEISSIQIIGETNFLYKSDKQLASLPDITLTAKISPNCNINEWQYKNSSGSFVSYPLTYNESINNTTLRINCNEQNIWINDGKTAVIRVTTNDPNTYDIVQVNKLYDGAAGDTVVSAILTNENHSVPVDSNNNVTSWIGAETQLFIYEGGTDVTSDWQVTINIGQGLSGTYDQTTHVFTPNALTANSSYVDFQCSRSGYDPLIKRYTIIRQLIGANGEDAVIYEIVPDYYTINQNEEGLFNPSSITFTAYTKTGSGQRTLFTEGQMVFYETQDGTNFTEVTRSAANDSSYVYTPSSNNILAIKAVLYRASTNIELDSQSVVVTKDGKSGLFMGLGNYTDVIPCLENGAVAENKNISIPFYSYKGINRMDVSAAIDSQTLPAGITVISNISGTASSDGEIILSIAKNSLLGNTTNGDINITLSSDGKSNIYKYTWAKNLKAMSGENAILLQLYSEDGGNVKVGKDTTIKAIMYSGSLEVIPSSIVWKRWEAGDYRVISGQNTSSITITEAMVTDQLWLKCEASYGSNPDPYIAYYTVDDVTDPVTSYTRATVKDFKNGEGFGAIYTRLYRGADNTEVDPIKSMTFSDVPPSTPQTGDYYYHLDSTAKTCTLMKYTGYGWDVASDTSDQDEYIYRYYRVDENGSIDQNSAWKTGRCQYVDPTIIGERMQFICEVSTE